MKVIGSGFGRTGTLSLKYALEELGVGPCFHMEEVLRHRRRQVGPWHDVALGRGADWNTIFKGYNSTVDYPASVVYRDLMEVFPEAKIVHTVRDPDDWYESTYETIYQGDTLLPRWLRRILPVTDRWVEMVDLLVWERLFDGRFEDRAYAIERYEEWTDEVIATVPPERLLVFEVTDGWGPLCEFLGLLQPDTAFPRANDRATMLKRFRRVRAASRAAPVVGAGVAATVYGMARRLRRR